MNIGLTQLVATLGTRGERRDCLDQAWELLLLGQGYRPIPLPNCSEDVEELITALRLRGVILTGGNDLAHLPDATDTAPERDAFERNLLEVCTRRRLPVLGVCRGMQMLVDHCGGRVGPIEGHVATMHALTMHPLARKCPFPMPGLERQAVNSFHRYGTLVGQEGPALRVAASARDGTVEAVVHESLPQWGIMWHPERSPNDPGDRLILSTLFAKAST